MQHRLCCIGSWLKVYDLDWVFDHSRKIYDLLTESKRSQDIVITNTKNITIGLIKLIVQLMRWPNFSREIVCFLPNDRLLPVLISWTFSIRIVYFQPWSYTLRVSVFSRILNPKLEDWNMCLGYFHLYCRHSKLDLHIHQCHRTIH